MKVQKFTGLKALLRNDDMAVAPVRLSLNPLEAGYRSSGSIADYSK